MLSHTETVSVFVIIHNDILAEDLCAWNHGAAVTALNRFKITHFGNPCWSFSKSLREACKIMVTESPSGIFVKFTPLMKTQTSIEI